MNRALVASSFLCLLTCLTGSARGQSCGYPWTVTATPLDSQTVAVHLCGIYVGCLVVLGLSRMPAPQVNC